MKRKKLILFLILFLLIAVLFFCYIFWLHPTINAQNEEQRIQTQLVTNFLAYSGVKLPDSTYVISYSYDEEFNFTSAVIILDPDCVGAVRQSFDLRFGYETKISDFPSLYFKSLRTTDKEIIASYSSVGSAVSKDKLHATTVMRQAVILRQADGTYYLYICF